MKCNISIKTAFKSIFRQSHFVKKLIIGGVFSLLATFLMNLYALLYIPTVMKSVGLAILIFTVGILGILLHFLITCLLIGYNIKFVHNAIHDKEEILPCWSNFKSLFIMGIKWLGISIIYFIAVIVVSVVLTAILMIPCNYFPILSFLFLIPTAFIVVASVTLPLLETMFAHNLEISDAFNLVRAKNLIVANFWQYLMLLVITFGIYLLAVIPYALSALTIVGIILVPFLAFIVKLIVRNLFAQFYKLALEKEIVND